MRQLTNKQIAKLIDLHCGTWFIENGHIFAISYYRTKNGRIEEETADLTGYTTNQMKDFLNY